MGKIDIVKFAEGVAKASEKYGFPTIEKPLNNKKNKSIKK